MANYTQGEWVKQGLLIATVGKPGKEGVIIADTRAGNNLHESDANANLIAAAPEMYEALHYALRYVGIYAHTDNVARQLQSKFQQALAKAEGKL
ncbi:MAG: hypothetical protein PHU23_19260 [Dehalococcoidales bacterium]|nr:hypothetical protein [Dehalococcoidales bacterium]